MMAGRQSRQAEAYDLALGQRVRTARRLGGLTQQQLGTALNISFQQVQKYENGANRISCSTLKLISTALGVPMLTLLGETGEPQTDALRVDPAVLKSARDLSELPHACQRVVESLIHMLASAQRPNAVA